MPCWITRALLALSHTNPVSQVIPSPAFAFGAEIRVKAGLRIRRMFRASHYDAHHSCTSREEFRGLFRENDAKELTWPRNSLLQTSTYQLKKFPEEKKVIAAVNFPEEFIGKKYKGAF